MILDFRDNIVPDDLGAYAGAAQAAAFFTRDAESPFTVTGGSVPFVPAGPFHPAHPFHGPTVVLINHDTGGAAEALAVFLKKEGALVMGQPASRNGGVFEQKTLGAGQVLLYEVNREAVSSDLTDFWNHPLVPDITLKVNDQAEKAALTLIESGRVLDLLQETAERHRMSEAALIKGEDPEWDAYLATLEKKKNAPDAAVPLPHDIVLTAALDSLKAIRISQERVASPDGVSPPTPSSAR